MKESALETPSCAYTLPETTHVMARALSGKGDHETKCAIKAESREHVCFLSCELQVGERDTPHLIYRKIVCWVSPVKTVRWPACWGGKTAVSAPPLMEGFRGERQVPRIGGLACAPARTGGTPVPQAAGGARLWRAVPPWGVRRMTLRADFPLPLWGRMMGRDWFHGLRCASPVATGRGPDGAKARLLRR